MKLRDILYISEKHFESEIYILSTVEVSIDIIPGLQRLWFLLAHFQMYPPAFPRWYCAIVDAIRIL